MPNYRATSKEGLERELAIARRARAEHHPCDDGTSALVHELQVHQIELEMQNLELRAAQAELAESTARYADLYDSAPIPYCTFDATGLLIDINLTGARTLGWERAEVLGRPFVGIARVKDPADFFRHIRACFEGAERPVTEVAITTRAAGAVTVQMISTPSHDREGKVVGCRTALVDVTERKRAVEVLQLFGDLVLRIDAFEDTGFAVDELASMLVPGVADLSVVLLFGGATHPRRVAVAHADSSRAGAVRELEQVFPDLPGIREAVTRVADSGAPELVADFLETAAAAAEAAPVLAELAIGSLIVVPLTSRGRALGVLAMATSASGRRYGPADLTLAKGIGRRVSRVLAMAQRYGDALRAAQARDEMLALVSHDLGGTASAIAMAAAALLERSCAEVPGAGSRRQVELIRRSAESMQQMVRDLLDTALIEMGHLRLNRTHVAVVDLARDAIEVVKQSAEQAGVQIVVDAPPRLGVLADRLRMRQVLVNLLSNALKFSDSGAAIRIAADGDGDRVEIAVSDEGPGIPEPDRARVFDAFWHGGRSHGTGLGLAIAKRIIDVHGERIRAENTPGSGATVSFTLPRASLTG